MCARNVKNVRAARVPAWTGEFSQFAYPYVHAYAKLLQPDPSVQQRLRSLQADMIEEPGVWARLPQALGAKLPGRAPGSRFALSFVHYLPKAYMLGNF